MDDAAWSPPAPIGEEAVRDLFADARSSSPLLPEPVPEPVLAEVVHRMRMAPTSMNLQSLRLVLIESPQARAKLVQTMSGGNRERVAEAPTVLVLAADTEFHLLLARTYPVSPNAAEQFADAAARERTALDNAWLQAGFFFLAARSMGLAVGPMGGFDAERADREVLASASLRAFLVLVLGYPSGPSHRRRLPRLEFEDLLLVR